MKKAGLVVFLLALVLATPVSTHAQSLLQRSNNSLLQTIGAGGGVTIGEAVSGGTANEVLYTDPSGNVGSDDGFTRIDDSSFIADATSDTNALPLQLIVDDSFTLGGALPVEGLAMILEDGNDTYYNGVFDVPAFALRTVFNGFFNGSTGEEYAIQLGDGFIQQKWDDGTDELTAILNTNGFVVTGKGTGGAEAFAVKNGSGTDIFQIDDDGVITFNAGSNSFTPPNDRGANGEVFTSNGSGGSSWQTPATTTPAGSNTEIQFNNSGSFGAQQDLAYLSSGGASTLSVGSSGGDNGVVAIFDNTGAKVNLGYTGGLFSADNVEKFTVARTMISDLTNSSDANIYITDAGTVIPTTVTGNRNVGIGVNPFKALIGGSQNTGIGGDGASSDGPLYELTSGNFNVALGAIAGKGITSGSSNTFIGSNTEADVNVSESIALGEGTIVTASNQFAMGSNGSPITEMYLGAGVIRGVQTDLLMTVTGRQGTDFDGGTFTIAAPKGTGAGDPGSIEFQIPQIGTTGTTLQSLDTIGKFDGVNKSFIAGEYGDGTVTVNGTSRAVRAMSTSDETDTHAGWWTIRNADSCPLGCGYFGFRSRGDSGTPTIVQDGDAIITYGGAGYDGTDYAQAGRLTLEVDGTPGSNDMPGAWVMSVSPDGSQSPSEALRVDSNKTTITDVMNIAPRSAAPGSAVEGDIYVDSDTNELCFYDGSSWTGLKAGGACS